MGRLVFECSIPMTPVPKGRPRFTRTGRAYTPKKTVDAENEVKEWVLSEWGDYLPLTGPLSVTLTFAFKQSKSNKKDQHTQRPDGDNLGKLVTDAMNGVVYEDDCQIVAMHIYKIWDEESGVTIVVREAP